MVVKRFGDVDDHVGKRIRERRRMVGMTQAKLAEPLGISYQQIQKYELGTNRVSAGRLYVLSEILGVTIDYFFEGPGAPVKTPPNPQITG